MFVLPTIATQKSNWYATKTVYTVGICEKIKLSISIDGDVYLRSETFFSFWIDVFYNVKLEAI